MLDDDGTQVLCHECGKRYRMLPTHLLRAHGLTADQYRLAHGIAPRQPLESASTNAKKTANGYRVYEQRPDIRAALGGGTKSAAAALTRAAQRAAPDLARRASVRHRRSVNAARNAARQREEKQRLLDARAQAAGYPSIAEWLAGHPALTGEQIAVRLGISRSAARGLRRATATRLDPHARMAAIARVVAGERLRAVAPGIDTHPDTLRAWVVASAEAHAAAEAAGYPDAGTWLTHRNRLPEHTRRKAVQAVLAGESRAHVARRLGVTDVAVGNWVRTHQSGEPDRGVGHAG
ncbi:MucR family transcriptional regulator [Streptomyces sp. 6N106]|uniref:MucR family transcriptional regulator n=1 Tax=Streptomyces sp. 6N106 TaxID=3457418 RepID=UPI003FD58F15